jgi:DNA-binding NarL/FixJ family response regulator
MQELAEGFREFFGRFDGSIFEDIVKEAKIPSPPTIRVLLADDHQVVRRGLRAAVESMPGWSVCGEAATGREAVEMAVRLRPEIVVLDMTMPELSGLDATQQIRQALPETEVLMLTGHVSEELVRQVFAAGARSFLVKTAGTEHLEAALRSLAAHKPYFTGEVAEVLFARFMATPKRSAESEAPGPLSTRERQIVQFLAGGKSNKEVAGALGISVKTVETHRAAIMKKLKLQAFSELVRYAVRNHLVEP